MDTKDTHTRTKILFYVIFTILTLVFIGWIYRFYTHAKLSIYKEQLTIQCSDYGFEVLEARYQDNILKVELKNKGRMNNINYITLMQEGMQRQFVKGEILPGDSRWITFTNVTSEGPFSIYVENCTEYAKTIETI